MAEFLESLTEYLRSLDDWYKAMMTFLISIVPVIELRGAIPVAAHAGLPWFAALPSAVLGNMLPVPFIMIFGRRFFAWLRRHTPFGKLADRLEARAEKKIDTVRKYQFFGLLIFVAIPLPGTGAWTGALIAAMMDLRMRTAVPSILLGVIGAGLIMSALSYGLFGLGA
ncbi:MAG: small multi-drug export protein [Oscillospiraceae bacterium]|nr:small multi-drug export protein [Oscillospiraceae bacterium]